MITDALEKVIAALGRYGIDGTLDPPKINPPAAWVSARRLARPRLAGSPDVVVDVFLIARDAGIPTAIHVLEGMLADVLDLVDDDDDLEIDWNDTDLGQSVTLPQGGGAMPAYKITLTVENN